LELANAVCHETRSEKHQERSGDVEEGTEVEPDGVLHHHNGDHRCNPEADEPADQYVPTRGRNRRRPEEYHGLHALPEDAYERQRGQTPGLLASDRAFDVPSQGFRIGLAVRMHPEDGVGEYACGEQHHGAFERLLQLTLELDRKEAQQSGDRKACQYAQGYSIVDCPRKTPSTHHRQV